METSRFKSSFNFRYTVLGKTHQESEMYKWLGIEKYYRNQLKQTVLLFFDIICK